MNERAAACFPNKVQRFKPPLVTSKDFPSRVSINNDFGSAPGEAGELGENYSYSAMGTNRNLEKPPITHWRRAEFRDSEAVIRLIQKSDFAMNDLFREPDVPNLIEKASFSLIQFNSKDEVISFTSIFSYPDIPAVPAFEWYCWLETLYRLRDVTPRNCFFIHYMIWDSNYYHDFLNLALQTIFLENMFLNHLIITKPPKVKLPSIIPKYFVQILPQDAELYDCDCNSLQTVLLCLRHSLMERLKIRLAIVEDHDDLMPIAEEHTERLRELYGDYSMAEIIDYPGTDERKTLVCESKGYAVGFMIINRAVDFGLLNSQFNLDVFHGLKKPCSDDKISGAYAPDPAETPVYLPRKVDQFLEIIDSETMLKFLNWQPSLCVTEEDLSESKLSSSESETRGYNDLSKSMSQMLKETLNVRLAPKFSAHALNAAESGVTIDNSIFSFPASQYRTYSDESEVGEQVTIKSEQSLLSLQHYNLPTYNGPANAFLIEFYAMHKSFDDRLCQDFLDAAFEEFPDLEYCLITLPSQAPTFPLLDLFTRVTPRPLKRFRQELYVCHRTSVMVTFMRVRPIVKADLKEIQELLRGIKNNEHIYSDIVSSCYYEDSAYQGFLLVCSKSIVGAAVLWCVPFLQALDKEIRSHLEKLLLFLPSNEYGMEYLAHHYHVSDLIDFDLHKMDYHAILKHLVLSPIYQPHARFFLRDIMRMADVTSLYRTRYEEVESNWNRSSLITVLGQLIPVKPRKMVKYHAPSLGSNMPPSFFTQKDIPFSLYHINSRVCGVKKLTCNINLVVVGSSTTAYSFLEHLLFSDSSPYVTYHNITWVSPHGMGTELPLHEARDLIFPFEGKYCRFYKIQLCLKTYVHFVYGVMTEINRIEKYIKINNDCIIPYDYLVLLCGRQFVMPTPLILMKDVKECRRNYRPRCSLFKYLITQQVKEETDKTIYPPNVFLINTDVDATNAFISLQYLVQRGQKFKENEKVIIYGHHISIYLCAQALLEYGIEPRFIAIVEPFPTKSHTITCLKDENIDKAVIRNLKELGVDHYLSYVLYDWTFCNNGQIETATFHSEHRQVTIKCIAMFPFEQKQVSDVTFKAVNEASLVYDGKLVINSNFQTNDPYIYAAGGLTKYQRKYYSKNKNHHYYNSSEVGSHLANIIRKKIDPTEDPRTETISELVPNMTKPVSIYGILPGGWHYLNVRKPGKLADPETRAGIKEFGDVLITGDCEMTNGFGYFKLMLDDCGFVCGLFCYTKDVIIKLPSDEEIDVENLAMLYGKHEELLNSLLLRFDLGMITDLFSYFREPWVYAIFHDRFHIVMKTNTELMNQEIPTGRNERVIDTIINTLKANNWQRPSKEKMMEIQYKFEQSGLKKEISENILNFLCYFDEPFPMYATPRILRVLLHDSRKSLLHKTQSQEMKYNKPTVKISETVGHYK